MTGKIIFLVALIAAFSIRAAWIPSVLLWEVKSNDPTMISHGLTPQIVNNGGPDGKSDAFRFSLSCQGDSFVTFPLNTDKIRGLIAFEAMIRGEKLAPGAKSYLGPKMMLTVSRGKDTLYPEAAGIRQPLGSYKWRRVIRYFQLPTDTAKLSLTFGIQGGRGTLEVADVRIYQVKEISDADAATLPAPINHEAVNIPRGKFTGTQYRGVMSGHDLSPAAFAELKNWGVNLIRYQIIASPKIREKIQTEAEYLAWIDQEIEKLDSILPLAKVNGVKMVIDIHTGPGTKISKVASNILIDSENSLETLKKAWIKLARHYKGCSGIYGYDLLNEPVVQQDFNDGNNSWKHMAGEITKTIRKIDKTTPVIIAWHQCEPFLIDDAHVIYSPHFYSPHSYTHQGILSDLKWGYPGMIDGVYWNKEQMRVDLKTVIEFSQKHRLKIFIGEFGCIAWVPRGRAEYIKDCIELFEEYGWDWTFHAFREWQGWSVEHEFRDNKFVESSENSAKCVLLKAFGKNHRAEFLMPID
jgi:hypothetical protein